MTAASISYCSSTWMTLGTILVTTRFSTTGRGIETLRGTATVFCFINEPQHSLDQSLPLGKALTASLVKGGRGHRDVVKVDDPSFIDGNFEDFFSRELAHGYFLVRRIQRKRASGQRQQGQRQQQGSQKGKMAQVHGPKPTPKFSQDKAHSAACEDTKKPTTPQFWGEVGFFLSVSAED